jgi:cytidylate kinase
MGCLLVLGGDVLRGLAFILTLGIVVGTYSSIFVASPFALIWERWFGAEAKVRRSSLSILAWSNFTGRGYVTLYNVLPLDRERTSSLSDTTSTDRPRNTLIAIDGPAGAGKSSVAARLAKRLGLPYIDTGAMYRTVALLALREGLELPLDDSASDRVPELMREHAIDVEVRNDGTRILVDGDEVNPLIRTPEVSLMASAVSALQAVRKALVPLQRGLAEREGGVMEGRDIGTVVLPDADLKIYLTASADERATRRHRDLKNGESGISLDEVLQQQHQRDLQDTSRTESPLQVARGSVVVDTTGLSLDEVVDRLFEEVEGHFKPNA